MLLITLMLLGTDPLVDRDGAKWSVKELPPETLGGGMAERRGHEVLRGAEKITTLYDSSFFQTNPTMAGSIEWSFAVVDGVFTATGAETRITKKDGKDDTTHSAQVLKWDGKQLSPVAAKPKKPAK
jgi:hypothetical protein